MHWATCWACRARSWSRSTSTPAATGCCPRSAKSSSRWRRFWPKGVQLEIARHPDNTAKQVDGAALRARAVRVEIARRAGIKLQAGEEPGLVDLGDRAVRGAMRTCMPSASASRNSTAEKGSRTAPPPHLLRRAMPDTQDRSGPGEIADLAAHRQDDPGRTAGGRCQCLLQPVAGAPEPEPAAGRRWVPAVMANSEPQRFSLRPRKPVSIPPALAVAAPEKVEIRCW